MKLQELIKMEKKLQKPYPTDYNLLKAQVFNTMTKNMKVVQILNIISFE